MGGFDEGGAIYNATLKVCQASTRAHPLNALTSSESLVVSDKLGLLRAGRELRYLRPIAGPVPQDGPEDARQTASQRDDRDAVPAALLNSQRPIGKPSTSDV